MIQKNSVSFEMQNKFEEAIQTLLDQLAPEIELILSEEAEK